MDSNFMSQSKAHIRPWEVETSFRTSLSSTLSDMYIGPNAPTSHRLNQRHVPSNVV